MRLNWELSSSYSHGVDRVVCYIDGQGAIPWTGAVSIEESESSGELTPVVYDGLAVDQRVDRNVYRAKLTAYDVPFEVREVSGETEVVGGLFVDGQPIKSLDMSFREMRGSSELIHLLYNVRLVRQDTKADTNNATPSPGMVEYELYAFPDPDDLPSSIPFRPTAHAIIAIDELTEAKKTTLRNMLYGTDTPLDIEMTLSSITSLYLLLGG